MYIRTKLFVRYGYDGICEMAKEAIIFCICPFLLWSTAKFATHIFGFVIFRNIESLHDRLTKWARTLYVVEYVWCLWDSILCNKRLWRRRNGRTREAKEDSLSKDMVSTHSPSVGLRDSRLALTSKYDCMKVYPEVRLPS